MNTTEGAAKQRLTRSLEKLRHRLTRHSTAIAIDGAAGLATLLAAHAVRAAPARLIAAATTTATSTASFTIAKGAIAMMTITKLKTVAALVTVASLLTTGVFVATNRGARAEDAQRTGAQPNNPNLQAKAAARVTAAENLIALLEARERAGDPLTPSFVDLRAQAFRQLADARIDAAPADLAARTRAAEQYVQQSRGLLAILEKRLGQDVSRVQVAQATLHLADAEYLLAKLNIAP